jgi:hypothetical protein
MVFIGLAYLSLIFHHYYLLFEMPLIFMISGYACAITVKRKHIRDLYDYSDTGGIPNRSLFAYTYPI